MAKILLGNIRGKKGDTGNGLTIMDYFDTIDELPTDPMPGDAYGVKNDEGHYDIHIYSFNKGWVNNGTLQPDINEQAPNYGEATTLENLTSGEKISIAFGKIKKATRELISHLSNKENPHNVTASQVGAFHSMGFMSEYDTVLAAASLPGTNGYSFFAVDGSPLHTAEDSAFINREVQYLVFVDDAYGARRTVVALGYSYGGVKIRRWFSNGWLSDWVTIIAKGETATNADTVDGVHAYNLATLAANGTSHGTSYLLFCQHNVRNDNRFVIKIEGVDVSVDHAVLADTLTDGKFEKLREDVDKIAAKVGLEL